jgi:hypothetical protein
MATALSAGPMGRFCGWRASDSRLLFYAMYLHPKMSKIMFGDYMSRIGILWNSFYIFCPAIADHIALLSG